LHSGTLQGELRRRFSMKPDERWREASKRRMALGFLLTIGTMIGSGDLADSLSR